ncbi:MAG: transglycosylase domain-containing protein [Anaerolineales bacterium]|uniref:transglycosylase domain-containing protein n=1 Tax=Candidatus Villigracilis proximus TaxID=3140683 RepID=UPI003135C9C9|nr:transglycosylase domain-containing protein [Anaerolineales bacterium]
MQKFLPILRSRRERRLAKQRNSSNRARGVLLGAGMIFSLVLAAVIIFGAFAYADVTCELPSVEILPRLLNPPNGLLLEPTRIYDRTGTQLLFTFSPEQNTTRRYIPVNKQNPQHIPSNLIEAVVAVADPQFWSHAGYTIQEYDNPEQHPTIAQKLVGQLILYNEEPSLRRAIRERILAAQITAQFGRTQIMEWYLNSAHFGNYAFGVEAASQLYFGKAAEQLTLAESAILAATSETPALNPLDAPQVALQRGREVVYILNGLGIVSNEDTVIALAETPKIQSAPLSPPNPAPAFVNMVLSQLDSQIPRDRLELGGLNIITTLDYDLQIQSACVTEVYAARMAGDTESENDCASAGLLPSLPPAITLADSSASALILNPNNGQVLALVGETVQAQETPLVTAHSSGSSLDAFVYLTGFTRGLSPASLTWDVPSDGIIQNFDGEFHGPVRLRVALANDYQVPVETLKTQMGIENVTSIASSFGINLSEQVSMLQLAGAYGVFGNQGVYFGQNIDDEFSPSAVLRVESADHSVLLDWTLPQAKPVLTPALAYLMTHVLSDETARWPSLGRSNALEIGRPAGVKMGQTIDGLDAWVVGYTPSYVVVTWTGVHGGENETVSPRFPAVLWNALMQLASGDSPADGWTAPQGVSVVTVCDPSGMLPTRECPNLVSEVFLNGSEPIQADNLYREFGVNSETGLLATVFTTPELIENGVYLLVPESARDWALSAGLEIPPTSYDAIQAPSVNPTANITAPKLFAEVSEVVKIIGTASGENFDYYRVQVGKGLNPTEWIQLGSDAIAPVESGVLAEWDTKGLSGLYAIQLLVVRSDQIVNTAVIQVTIK